MTKRSDGKLFCILVAVGALIVYGSLYPWKFEFRQLPATPFWILLHSWDGSLRRRFLADIVVNVALYLPLGTAGYLAFRKHRIAGPVVLGIILSASVEMLQLFVPGRDCSGFDFVDNTIGTLAGVLCGKLLAGLAGHFPEGRRDGRPADHSAIALVFCWVASLLFPLFPVTRLATLHAKMALLLHGSWFAPVPFLSGALNWLAAGWLLVAAGVTSAELCLGISLLLLPAQFFIDSRRPLPVDVLASVTGFLLFRRRNWRPRLLQPLACSLLAMLVVRGLAPFHFAAAQPFNWLPFGGFLATTWQSGINVLLEKTFLYGTAMWLLRAAGKPWPRAIAPVVIALTVVEAVQIYLPGRTPEITDPLLAALVGLGLRALSPRPALISASSNR